MRNRTVIRVLFPSRKTIEMTAQKHLVFLVHGLFGNGSHMSSNAEELRTKFATDDSVIVHIAKSNETLKTFDGIVVGAERLFVELMDRIKQLLEEKVTVKYISIVGYSLGGLFTRYLIGMLESVGFFNKVTPVVYATFATPHVGTYFHSQRFKARILNAFGSRLLGLSGGDLFCCNDMLEEMSEPDSRYITGLKRFKKRILFANAVHDRTVPFWTSYLSTKNPFRHLEHVNLQYYDHSLVVKMKDIRPFLVNMSKSVYNESELHPPKLTRRDKITRALLFVLLPIFLPAMLTVLTTGTIVSRIKAIYYSVRPRPQDNTAMFNELSRQLTKTSHMSRVEPRRPSHHDLEPGSLAEGALENMLELVEPQEGEEEEKDMRVSGAPKPALNGGFEGLLEGTKYELGISQQCRRIIDNLNQLEWEKYAVALSHFNTHGEIMNRRCSKGQGQALQKFFAHLVFETYGDVKKQVSAKI